MIGKLSSSLVVESCFREQQRQKQHILNGANKCRSLLVVLPLILTWSNLPDLCIATARPHGQ
jgi:hypothetical protein